MADVRDFGWGTPEYHTFCELRQRMLRAPLGLNLYDEDLGVEKNHVHIGLFDDDRLAGGAILIDHGDAVGQLRQMLVIPELRNRGLGRRVVAGVEEAARARSMRTLFLHARHIAMDFYRRCGFATVGDEFVSHGIPHVRMEKSLDILETDDKNAVHGTKDRAP
ncbi:MAG: GNAT family N-acetyltransferase [Gammaproteobacteria bacterium]|nr:GNAT family N-acetyltransferase [Gammaproteobacteria bacterium]